MTSITPTKIGEYFPPYENLLDLLGKNIINTNFILIDGWSFVHFFFGFIIMKSIYQKRFKLSKINFKNKFVVLFSLLVFYETLELFLYGQNSILFRPESSVDIFTDIIVGLFGGYIYTLVKR